MLGTHTERMESIEAMALAIAEAPVLSTWEVEHLRKEKANGVIEATNLTLRVSAGSKKWALQAAYREDPETGETNQTEAQAQITRAMMLRMAKDNHLCAGCTNDVPRDVTRQKRYRCEVCRHNWFE